MIAQRKPPEAIRRPERQLPRSGGNRVMLYSSAGKPACQECQRTARSLRAIAAQLWLLAHELDGEAAHE